MRISILLISLLTSFCTAKYTYLKPDYNTTERLTLKRIAIFTDKNFLIKPELQDLLNDMTSEYISHHKEYIAKQLVTESPELACKSGKIDGYILNNFLKALENNKDLKLNLQSRLFKCNTQNVIWEVKIEKAYSINDQVTAVTNVYSSKYGSNVKVYINPFFDIIRNSLQSLPSPKLNAKDIQEKIESESL